MQNERQATIKRAVIILSLLVLNVVGIYLYYYVLIFNTVETGKVYASIEVNGGSFKVQTLKYYYQHKGISYFDQIDYVLTPVLQLGDSMDIRVLKPYPPKHMIAKVYRDESKTHDYNCTDGFTIHYNEHINQLKDYESQATQTILTPEGNVVNMQKSTPDEMANKIKACIDKLRFNQGSLIDYYIVQTNANSIRIHSIYHYLNDLSTDAMPSKVLHQKLKKEFPNKSLHLSIIEKDNPKKEHILDPNW
ncbi:MAG: hypothetical protein N4A71_24235 [Carboxylicivirga sp.]|jgi:hypothetical protein|nr:hypothetical protein [Carboxylicivirga sp.]